MKRAALLTVPIVLLVACSDQEVTQPRGLPSAALFDGANSITDASGNQMFGNSDFFFLPPIAPNPVNHTNFDAGQFDPDVPPWIIVIHLPANPPASCLDDNDVPVGELVLNPVQAVRVPGEEHYQILWDTDKSVPALQTDQFYRICAFDGIATSSDGSNTLQFGTPLGFLDVDPSERGVRNVHSEDFYEFTINRVVPVNMRVEEGFACGNQTVDCTAQFVDAETGGTVLAGEAGVFFGPNVLPADRLVVIEEVILDDIEGETCLGRPDIIEVGPCYSFRTVPGPTTFNGFAFVAICPVENLTGLDRFRQLFQEGFTEPLQDASATFVEGQCDQPIGLTPSGILNLAKASWHSLVSGLAGFAGIRPLFASTVINLGAAGSSSTFSRFVNAIRPAIAIDAGDDQAAVSGTLLPVDPTVRVTASHFNETEFPAGPPALPGLPVTFAPSGDGSASPVTVNTNADGLASTSWTIASTDGPNSLIARVPASGSSRQVTFNATGVTISAQVADATGDAVASSITPSPDLISATATATGGDLLLSVRFAPSTFDPQTSVADVALDMDQNPATGNQGVDAGGTDAGIVGTEFLVRMGSASQAGQASVLEYAGTFNQYNQVGTATVTFTSDGMDLAVPLALLDNDDGQMNLKVVTFAQISSLPSFTGILDRMPNAAAPAVTLTLSSGPVIP